MINRYETLKELVNHRNDIDGKDRRKLLKDIEVMSNINLGKTIAYGLAATVMTIAVFGFGYGFANKHYRVWAMEMEGKAKLAEATQSRQIQIEQAKGEKMAATFTAEAIAIVGKASKSFPEYRNQMFIQAFGDALNNESIKTIIYVPTEANIPILEAGSHRGGQ